MNYNRPELLDQLAARYVLGTLRGPARRRFVRLLPHLAQARAAVASWESTLNQLAQSVPPQKPSAQVWQRIEARINPAARSQPKAWWSSWLQPLLGVAFGVVMTLGLTRWLPQSPVAPAPLAQQQQTLPASYVGILLDQSGKPAVLASSTRHGRRLALKVLQPIDVPAGKVLMLWALPQDKAEQPLAPIRLGQVPAQGKGELLMADSAEKLLVNVKRLGVSLESAESSPAAPSELIISGHCVKLW